MKLRKKQTPGIKTDVVLEALQERETIHRLIRFCGHGKLSTANIIFLGTEEGFGGNGIDQVIHNRTVDFWNNGFAVDGHDNDNGYYYFGEGEGENITSPFLDFSSRLMLRLNNGERINFFQRRSDNPGVFSNSIIEYKVKHLYRENKDQFMFRSFLVDHRPLPRISMKDQKDAPNYYQLIDDKFEWRQYYNAFSQKSRKHFDDYHENLRDQRAEILCNVFTGLADLKIIIGIGDRHVKQKFFEHYFVIDRQFEQHQLAGRTPELSAGSILINNVSVPVFLSNFFQSGHGIGLEGLEVLAGMIEVTVKD